MNTIEVELRTFLDEPTYHSLISYFSEHGKLIKEDEQTTHYFDCKEDLRIQKNTHYSKIRLKHGTLHDDSREELEIKFNTEDFENLKNLFSTLGYSTEIIRLRKRLQYLRDDITVCLDHTQGYGYILELEKMSNPNDKDSVYQYLLSKLKDLHIPLTPKTVFQERYKHYKENWENLIEKKDS